MRCDELCGLWHGAMYNYGSVVSKAAVQRLGEDHRDGPTPPTPRTCPPFAYTYVPDANGADGGYYPDNVDPYSNVGDLRRHDPRAK